MSDHRLLFLSGFILLLSRLADEIANDMGQQFSDTDEESAVKTGNNSDFLKGERGIGDGAPAMTEDNGAYRKCTVSHVSDVLL